MVTSKQAANSKQGEAMFDAAFLQGFMDGLVKEGVSPRWAVDRIASGTLKRMTGTPGS